MSCPVLNPNYILRMIKADEDGWTMKAGKNIEDSSLKRKSKGQGLIETALIIPVLLIVLSGLLEFGFLLNDYLAMQDAARNAARFASDGLYYASDSNKNGYAPKG